MTLMFLNPKDGTDVKYVDSAYIQVRNPESNNIGENYYADIPKGDYVMVLTAIGRTKLLRKFETLVAQNRFIINEKTSTATISFLNVKLPKHTSILKAKIYYMGAFDDLPDVTECGETTISIRSATAGIRREKVSV